MYKKFKFVPSMVCMMIVFLAFNVTTVSAETLGETTGNIPNFLLPNTTMFNFERQGLKSNLTSVNAYLSADGEVILAWSTDTKNTAVNIYWTTDKDNIAKGQLLQGNVSGNTLVFAPPQQDRQIYYYIAPIDGGTGMPVAIRKLHQFRTTFDTVNRPVDNFRDIGGYKTKDGSYVKWGRLYRSNQLYSLSPTEIKFVESLGIKYNFDLRTDSEVKNIPDPVMKGVQMFYASPASDETVIINKNPMETWRLVSEYVKSQPDLKVYDFMIYANQSFIETGKPIFKQMFNLLAEDENAVLLSHCSGGKDRSGVTTALILTALGVDRETIIEDYMLSKPYREANNKIEMSNVQKYFQLSDDGIQNMSSIWDANPAYLQSFFDKVEEDYGSVENYIRNELGISEEKIQVIQNNLLEKY